MSKEVMMTVTIFEDGSAKATIRGIPEFDVPSHSVAIKTPYGYSRSVSHGFRFGKKMKTEEKDAKP